MSKPGKLIDKKIMVIGAAGLLGGEFCGELVDAGASVLAVDVNASALTKLSESLPTIECIQIDITDELQLVKLSELLVARESSIDGIVISTGIDAKVTKIDAGMFTKLEEFSLVQWEKEVAVGLTGPFLLLKHCSKHLSAGSSVVIISSDLSIISPDQRLYNIGKSELTHFKPITYSAIKSGLVGMVRYLSTYWAPRSIRVNSLSPGGVESDQPDSFKEELKKRIPLARLAQKDEYNKAILFLLSEDSRYMTGQNLVMDGGRSIW